MFLCHLVSILPLDALHASVGKPCIAACEILSLLHLHIVHSVSAPRRLSPHCPPFRGPWSSGQLLTTPALALFATAPGMSASSPSFVEPVTTDAYMVKEEPGAEGGAVDADAGAGTAGGSAVPTPPGSAAGASASGSAEQPLPPLPAGPPPSVEVTCNLIRLASFERGLEHSSPLQCVIVI